jgi:quercetin dioxygenase-like cupin family protein
MAETVLHRRGTILVRRLRLAQGEAMPWHRDPFERVTVVLGGEALAIEYRDGGPSERIALAAGQVDWDEPTARVHRAVNVGEVPYEEVTVFFPDRPDAVPQPQPADDAPDRGEDQRESGSVGARRNG